MMPAMHARQIDVAALLAVFRPQPPAMITLFTDAGHCPQTKVASYAVWAKTTGKPTLRHSGILKGTTKDATAAELRAIANGLSLVLSRFSPPPGSRIVAQTDSKGSIAAITGDGYKAPKTRAYIQLEIDRIREMLDDFELSIDLRHVRAHTGAGDKRSAVNEWCDQQCKLQLRVARQLVQN
jgi:ribonuclease HI